MKQTTEKLKERGICVIIPTYNNFSTIEAVVTATLEHCSDVIVVSDGSSDGTERIVKSLRGVTAICYKKNRGKGYALKRGFKRALEMGFAYAITLDADAQHFPSDIPRFLEANCQHPGKMIVGRRNLTGVSRRGGSSFANKFSNFWFTVQTWHVLHDTQSGMRLYPLKKLPPLRLIPSRYEAETALLVWAAWRGAGPEEIPIKTYYPPQEERVSHFRPGADFARIWVTNTVLCMLSIIYGMPRTLLRGVMALLGSIYAAFFFGTVSLLIVNPLAWIFIKTGGMTETKRLRLHGFIQRVARFFTIQHGIPGARLVQNLSHKPDFSKPQILICNHQSHLDLMPILALHPKIVFLTNDWVYNNIFYGLIIRHAEYLPASRGLQPIWGKLEDLIRRGYSVAVFPEGTRSRDCSIGRFHQGAFYMAREFGLDICPLFLYGAGKVLPKGIHHLNRWTLYFECAPLLTRSRLEEMGSVREQTMEVRRYYKEHFEEIKNRLEQDV